MYMLDLRLTSTASFRNQIYVLFSPRDMIHISSPFSIANRISIKILFRKSIGTCSNWQSDMALIPGCNTTN